MHLTLNSNIYNNQLISISIARYKRIYNNLSIEEFQ